MITRPVHRSINPITLMPQITVCDAAAYELNDTGCSVPDIMHVTFNLGEKHVPSVPGKNGAETKAAYSYKILTTVLDFADGTKVVVHNSEDDGLRLNPDGTASDYSKECGIVFALAKRILAGKYVVDNVTGELKYKDFNFGNKLSKLVKSAVDQNKLNDFRKQKHEAKLVKKTSITTDDYKTSVKADVAKISDKLENLGKNFRDVLISVKNIIKADDLVK